MLFHHQGWIFALGLFPNGFFGHKALFAPGVGHGFQATVLGVGATGLEGHHPALAAGHHHCVGNLKTLRIQTRQNF